LKKELENKMAYKIKRKKELSKSERIWRNMSIDDKERYLGRIDADPDYAYKSWEQLPQDIQEDFKGEYN